MSSPKLDIDGNIIEEQQFDIWEILLLMGLFIFIAIMAIGYLPHAGIIG